VYFTSNIEDSLIWY